MTTSTRAAASQYDAGRCSRRRRSPLATSPLCRYEPGHPLAKGPRRVRRDAQSRRAGVSSGGHLVHPGGRQPSLRCGVLRCQIRRCYRLAKQAGNASIVKSHDAYAGREAAMEEVNPPPILERGGHIGMPLLTPFRRHSKLATTRPKRVRWWIPLRTLSSVTAADK